MRVDAAVGAVGDVDAGGDGLAETLALRLSRVQVLAQDLRGPAVAAADAVDVVAVVDVGDQEGAKWKDGDVFTAPGWKDAYKQFSESGWSALAWR